MHSIEIAKRLFLNAEHKILDKSSENKRKLNNPILLKTKIKHYLNFKRNHLKMTKNL